MSDAKICMVCAWRENCQKKYSISKQGGAHCPDFTRDVSVARDRAEPEAQPAPPRKP